MAGSDYLTLLREFGLTGCPGEQPAECAFPDHAAAFAEALERAASRLRAGGNVEDIAGELLLTVRVAARRT